MSGKVGILGMSGKMGMVRILGMLSGLESIERCPWKDIQEAEAGD